MVIYVIYFPEKVFRASYDLCSIYFLAMCAVISEYSLITAEATGHSEIVFSAEKYLFDILFASCLLPY